MKFEQFPFFLATLNWKFKFLFVFLNNSVSGVLTRFLFSWKIFGYSDAYWFLYSNKKFFYEKKYL